MVPWTSMKWHIIGLQCFQNDPSIYRKVSSQIIMKIRGLFNVQYKLYEICIEIGLILQQQKCGIFLVFQVVRLVSDNKPLNHPFLIWCKEPKPI